MPPTSTQRLTGNLRGDNHDSGNPADVIGSKESHHGGDVVRLGDSPEGLDAQWELAACIGFDHRHVGFGGARGPPIYANVALAGKGECLTDQGNDSTLGGRIN